MKLEEIDKSTLKVGDTVGICTAIKIGRKYFKYDRVTPKTIARITPARTKFVTTDGCEYNDRYNVFYKIDNETRRKNHVIDCALEIRNSLDKLEDGLIRGNLLSKSDDDIIKISEILKELCKEIEEAEND